ncbi:MAG: hypothetical protein NC112_07045 [Oxalobacter formigenes]|nr:hypothetical protein [Oxalobacter formigenes]
MNMETGNNQNRTQKDIPSVITHPDESLKKLAAEEESVTEKIHDKFENAAESTKEAAGGLAEKTASTLHKAAGKIRDWTHHV